MNGSDRTESGDSLAELLTLYRNFPAWAVWFPAGGRGQRSGRLLPARRPPNCR
jgi:hypothetical protein